MLETLNRPNIKNIVLEEPLKSKSGYGEFNPKFDLTENDFQRGIFIADRFDVSANQDKRDQDNNILWKANVLARLKVLFPDHELPEFDSEVLDRTLATAYMPLATRIGSGLLSRFILNPTPFPEFIQERVKAYMDDNPNILELYLPHLNVAIPELARPYMNSPQAEDIWSSLNVLLPLSGDSNIKFGDLNTAFEMRLLDPQYKPLLSPKNIESAKKLLGNIRNEQLEMAFDLAVATADEIDTSNGLKLIYHDTIGKNEIPPYPEIDRTELKKGK